MSNGGITCQSGKMVAVLWWITGGLGVTLGYHRLLTHRSFQTYKWVEYLLTLFGTLSWQGAPSRWVGTHRLHHASSDEPGDPHSPHDGGWWSHILWLFPRPRDPAWNNMIQTYAKGLDPHVAFSSGHLDRAVDIGDLILRPLVEHGNDGYAIYSDSKSFGGSHGYASVIEHE